MQLHAIQPMMQPAHNTRFAAETIVVPSKTDMATIGSENEQAEAAKKKVMGAMSRAKFPYTHFFIIGGFITAGSMAMRGLIEGAIPWAWKLLTGF